MSLSYTYSESVSFTITHARHIATKVATDLKRMQRFYNCPSDGEIDDYQTELIALLKAGYLAKVTYGFKRNGEWIAPTLRYTAQELAGGSADDDDPGRIRPGANTSGASFYSFLTYSPAWASLSDAERAAFKSSLPFRRTPATEPGVNGYFYADHTYSAGGRALNRSSVRSFY